MVRHVGKMTGRATLLHRIMDIGPGKRFFLVALKAELFFFNIKELGILGVVHSMAGFTLTAIDRLMD